jgi:hypothetical protein
MVKLGEKYMAESKGWGIRRKEPLCTRNGIVLWRRGKGDWVIDFPDGWHSFGRKNTAQLITLMVYLAEGASLKEARRKAGWQR